MVMGRLKPGATVAPGTSEYRRNRQSLGTGIPAKPTNDWVLRFTTVLQSPFSLKQDMRTSACDSNGRSRRCAADPLR